MGEGGCSDIEDRAKIPGRVNSGLAFVARIPLDELSRGQQERG